MTEQAEHHIEFGQTGTWQAGTFHWASCECGWQSQRTTDQSVVETEANRHMRLQESGD
ncbi:MAG TPA: hypothetical protein VFX35_12465 [Solirubrobacterales bacterium]|nr:hypothetical protein [Solirubrobacterales bacterium]